MNTAQEIYYHRESLGQLHRAKERLHRVRFQRTYGRSEADCLAEVRDLERRISTERSTCLRRWTQVRKFNLGTSTEYSAWEPSSLFQHSSITSDPPQPDGGYWGSIGTRPLPQSIEDLRGGSPERLAAVAAWNDAQDREAWLVIIAACPEAAAGELKSSGRIVVRGAAQ